MEAAWTVGDRVALFLDLGSSSELHKQPQIFGYLVMDLSMSWCSERAGQICSIIIGVTIAQKEKRKKKNPDVQAIYHSTQVRPFWDYFGELTVHIAPEHLVSIDLAYVCDNVSLPSSGMKRWVFLMMLDVARMLA